jgi:Flp pilus assembly protein TadD
MRDSPLSWRANANHGDLLFREGRLEEGRAAYARAIAFAPSPCWIRHAFARHLSRTGDHDAALAQLATAIAEFPGQPEMLRDVIATLINMGRYGEARGIATRLIDAGRESAEIVRLGRLADSAVVAGAPAGAVRVEIASPRSAHQP